MRSWLICEMLSFGFWWIEGKGNLHSAVCIVVVPFEGRRLALRWIYHYDVRWCWLSTVSNI